MFGLLRNEPREIAFVAFATILKREKENMSITHDPNQAMFIPDDTNIDRILVAQNEAGLERIKDKIDALLSARLPQAGKFYKISHSTYVLCEINQHQWVLVNRHGKSASLRPIMGQKEVLLYLKSVDAVEVDRHAF